MFILVLVGGTACGGSPAPSVTPANSSTTELGSSPEASRTATASAEGSVPTSVWYEVDRVGDTHGNATRSLLFGTLGGELRGRLPLAEHSAAASDGSEPFAWTDPQADGVFARHVIVWGRDAQPGLIESVNLDTGAIESLATSDEIVHVATADAELAQLFFITVDSESHLPIALWHSPVGQSDAIDLDYTFSDQPVTNRFKYRLIAAPDGAFVAVQPMEGTVTIIDVAGGLSVDVLPGGPMIGFADNALIAYGPPSATGSRSLLAYDLDALREQVIADDISSAQVVPGTSGDVVVAMRISEEDARTYELEAISASTGASSIVYSHADGTIGPLLARRDRSFLGYELPPDWVLLVDSFLPFTSDPFLDPRNPPDSSYPLALNLRTGETHALGPFSADGGG